MRENLNICFGLVYNFIYANIAHIERVKSHTMRFYMFYLRNKNGSLVAS